MMRSVMLSAVAATAMIIASPVLAQSEEEKIREVVEAMISDMSGGDPDAMGMKWDGELTVTEANGGFYLARLPSLSIIDPNGSGVEVGVIAMNVRARPDADYDLAIAMPDPMYVIDENDRVAEITIGEQRLFARWSSEVDALRTVKLDWRDMVITGLEEGDEAVVRMEQIALDTDNTPSGEEGLWNNSVGFSMTGITADSPDNVRVFALGKMNMVANTTNYDYPGFVTFNRKMQAVQTKMADPAMMSDPSKQQALMGELSETIKGAGQIMGSDFTVQFDLDTLKISDESGDEGGGIDQVMYRMEMDDLTEDNANAKINWMFNGLSISPAMDHHRLLPRRSDGEIAINAIPTKKLLQTATSSLDTMAAGGPPPMMALFQAPMFFAQAGTSIDIGAANVNSQLVDMTSTGRFYMTEELMMGNVFMAGKLTANISGLDAALAEASQSDDPQMKQAEGTLNMLRNLGTDIGDDKRSFEIELTTDGKRLINGQDMDTVMSGGGSPQ
ncbi:MAG: hypothetical protein Alpg2KO_16010 [Alphaproteobacteria bacterium]